MLLEFRVKNFLSFKEEQVFSLLPAADTSLEENILKEGEFSALKYAALYGPNASGKSNFIKAIDFFIDLIRESTSPKPGRPLHYRPFLLDSQTAEQPSEFEMTFICEGVRYQYGFSLIKERIINEWLFAFPQGKTQKWFVRSFDEKIRKPDWKWSSFLKGERESIADKTLENALFLSVAAQWNNEQTKKIYEYLDRNIRIIFCDRRVPPVTKQFFLDTKKTQDEITEEKDLIVDLMRNADLGIADIAISRKEVSDRKFPDGMPETIKQRILDNLSVRISFVHKNLSTNATMELPIEEESGGTKRLFELLGPILQTAAEGYIVFIDELETSMHPLLTRFLLQFMSGEYNKGQIVFTTHDATLLSSELFRRDQIWFTEKNKNGESKLYPLSDYKPRKGEALQKNYLAGRYGAIPILEEFKVNG